MPILQLMFCCFCYYYFYFIFFLQQFYLTTKSTTKKFARIHQQCLSYANNTHEFCKIFVDAVFRSQQNTHSHTFFFLEPHKQKNNKNHRHNQYKRENKNTIKNNHEPKNATFVCITAFLKLFDNTYIFFSVCFILDFSVDCLNAHFMKIGETCASAIETMRSD